MSKLRNIILLTLCLLPALMVAQRRYSTSSYIEGRGAKGRGFSTRDVENKTDVLFGLHASQYSGAHHLIGFSVEGGWSTFWSDMPYARITPKGGEGGLHLLYEYQYSGLLLQTGIGVAYQRVTTAVTDSAVYHPGMQDGTLSFTLKHQFTERQDMAQQAYARIPLYLGHYFFGSHGIGYFLGGVQAGIAVWGNTKQQALGTTTGLYERYVGVFEEMDNHAFRKEVPFAREGNALKLKTDFLAHVELGYEYNTRQAGKNYRAKPSDRLDGRLRFAVYAEMGILSIMPSSSGNLYSIPTNTIYDFPTYGMDHVFATNNGATYWLRNISAGIRITFLIGFKPEERCILCNQWKQ